MYFTVYVGNYMYTKYLSFDTEIKVTLKMSYTSEQTGFDISKKNITCLKISN